MTFKTRMMVVAALAMAGASMPALAQVATGAPPVVAGAKPVSIERI